MSLSADDLLPTVETRHVREVGPLTHNVLVQTPSVQRRRIVIPSRGTGILAARLQRRSIRRYAQKKRQPRRAGRWIREE